MHDPAARGAGDRESYVTVSVDDGHPSDQHAADLLSSLGYAATFYVPARNPEREVLEPGGVRRLAEAFELGGHTYNHLALPPLDRERARREIRDGKDWLEDAISAPVKSFCYPRGKFDRQTRDLVAEAGFAGARTTMGNIVTLPHDAFLAGATTQAFSHPRRIHARHAVVERNWRGAANYMRIFRFATDWTEHFELGVAHVCSHGGVAHLWFHSWELDEYEQWGRLEHLLRRIKDRYEFQCTTNGRLFALGSGTRAP
jgi:peptidoglycan/xylan/chitin deacetylase (PgdA/CDA1 family)